MSVPIFGRIEVESVKQINFTSKAVAAHQNHHVDPEWKRPSRNGSEGYFKPNRVQILPIRFFKNWSILKAGKVFCVKRVRNPTLFSFFVGMG